MKKKKQEVILLNEVVSLEKFFKINDINIFPLCIVLTDEEGNNFDQLEKLSEFKVINELYFRSVYSDLYLYMNPYKLRDMIDRNEIFITKFIDKNEEVKNVDFIAPVWGLQEGAPKIVFRKSPRLFFKKADHFSIDKKYIGEDLFTLAIHTMNEHQRSLVKKKV